jgi:hypothetical protein
MTPATLKVVNPLDIPYWNELVLAFPECSVFHSSGWARVLQDTYGVKPLYACVFQGETLSACLPLMEVASLLTGNRGVSLPFTDFCPPLLNGTTPFRDLFDFAIAFGKDRHWKYLELRGKPNEPNEPNELNKPNEPTKPYTTFSHHLLDLCPGVDTLYKNLRESTGRNIRKAEKEGVTIRFGNDLGGVKAYFRLHCLTRKRHGVPPQPWLFFENIYKNLISAGQGFVALAEYQGKKIAGGVYLTLGASALYKFGASDLSFQNLRANNLVMWRAVRHLAETGFRTLSFGRTEPENQGLIQFKSGWGAVEKRQDYFRYDFGTQNFITADGKGLTGYEKVFQKLPEPALKLMGKVLYRHFGS